MECHPTAAHPWHPCRHWDSPPPSACPAPAARQPGQMDGPCAAGTSRAPSPRGKRVARWDAGHGAAPAVQDVTPPCSSHFHLLPEELPPPCPKAPFASSPSGTFPPSSPSITGSQRHGWCQDGSAGGAQPWVWAARVLLGAMAPLPLQTPKSPPILVPAVDGDAGRGAPALTELLLPCGLGQWTAACASWDRKHRAGGNPCTP